MSKLRIAAFVIVFLPAVWNIWTFWHLLRVASPLAYHGLVGAFGFGFSGLIYHGWPRDNA